MTLAQIQKEFELIQKNSFELKTKHHLEPIKDTSVFKKNKLKISHLMALISQKQHDN